jgi:hypothetical protein
MPGMRNSRPTCGFCRIFCSESQRLLPGRSGMTTVLSSSTRTKPGRSPLGETSHRPSVPDVPRSMNGERSMNARQCRSRPPSCFRTARSEGVPIISRKSEMLVTRRRPTVWSWVTFFMERPLPAVASCLVPVRRNNSEARDRLRCCGHVSSLVFARVPVHAADPHVGRRQPTRWPHRLCVWQPLLQR